MVIEIAEQKRIVIADASEQLRPGRMDQPQGNKVPDFVPATPGNPVVGNAIEAARGGAVSVTLEGKAGGSDGKGGTDSTDRPVTRDGLVDQYNKLHAKHLEDIKSGKVPDDSVEKEAERKLHEAELRSLTDNELKLIDTITKAVEKGIDPTQVDSLLPKDLDEKRFIIILNALMLNQDFVDRFIPSAGGEVQEKPN